MPWSYWLLAVALVVLLVWIATTVRVNHPCTDVCTDADEPLHYLNPFIAARSGDLNRSTPDAAALQRRAYPLVVPLYVNAIIPPQTTKDKKGYDLDVLFAMVEALASRTRGWTVVKADSRTRRVQIVCLTPTCRFQDDVMIEVRGTGRAGPTVHMRSRARNTARNDLGTNAHRIVQFLHGLEKAMRGL